MQDNIIQLQLDGLEDDPEIESMQIHIERFLDVAKDTAIADEIRPDFESLMSFRDMMPEEEFKQKLTALFDKACSILF